MSAAITIHPVTIHALNSIFSVSLDNTIVAGIRPGQSPFLLTKMLFWNLGELFSVAKVV